MYIDPSYLIYSVLALAATIAIGIEFRKTIIKLVKWALFVGFCLMFVYSDSRGSQTMGYVMLLLFPIVAMVKSSNKKSA